jgi:hypothetical protein
MIIYGWNWTIPPASEGCLLIPPQKVVFPSLPHGFLPPKARSYGNLPSVLKYSNISYTYSSNNTT